MKFTWGVSEKSITNMCPFFWISIFNVIIFPITCVIKGIKYLIMQILILIEFLTFESYAKQLKALQMDTKGILILKYAKKYNKNSYSNFMIYLIDNDYKMYLKIKDLANELLLKKRKRKQ